MSLISDRDFRFRLTALLLSLWILLPAHSQDRPVLSAFTVGLGSSHLADTYLTPLKYEGWSLGAGYERMQAFKSSPEEWITRLYVTAELNRAVNPAGNARMWAFDLSASWGFIRRYTLPYGIKVGIGPAATIQGGCLYNNRNSNNPASAKAAATLDVTGFAAWNTRIGSLPVTLRYQPSLPVVGAFFSPCYDELYFEIYMGNRHGLVHPAWWGNRFELDQLVTLDLHLGSSSLRLGYDCEWMSSRVSNLTTRIITHRFVIGWTSEWMSSGKKGNATDRSHIISAMY